MADEIPQDGQLHQMTTLANTEWTILWTNQDSGRHVTWSSGLRLLKKHELKAERLRATRGKVRLNGVNCRTFFWKQVASCHNSSR